MTPLHLILATDAGLEPTLANGFFARQQRLYRAYAEQFKLTIHSADTRDFSTELGAGIHHWPLPPWTRHLPNGLRHAAYWAELARRAPQFRGIVRIQGVAVPVVPQIRSMSPATIVLTFEYDWAGQVRAEYHGLKRAVAPIVQTLALQHVHHVQATTPALAALAHQRYGVPATVIPNFVELDRFTPDPIRRPRSIVYFGRLRLAKGVTDLAAAAEKLAPRFRGLNVRLFGAGELRDELARIRVVELPGVVSQAEVAAELSQAEIFVLPSRTNEGNPKAVMEALAAGCAVVVTDVAGNRDLVRDGVNGRLACPNDAADLARVLAELLTDDAQRRRLQAAARPSVAQWDFAPTVQRECSLMHSLIGG